MISYFLLNWNRKSNNVESNYFGTTFKSGFKFSTLNFPIYVNTQPRRIMSKPFLWLFMHYTVLYQALLVSDVVWENPTQKQ